MLRQDGRQALAAALPKESKSPEKRKSVGWRKQHETCEMASGPANIPEFGTVKEPDGFKALYAMDAYQHVKPNAYPAVLLTAGVNDPRVAPWQAAKMTARLQASTTSGKPVLLRVDYDAGHGLGSTKSQRDTEQADEFCFLFWQFGVSGFQPAK